MCCRENQELLAKVYVDVDNAALPSILSGPGGRWQTLARVLPHIGSADGRNGAPPFRSPPGFKLADSRLHGPRAAGRGEERARSDVRRSMLNVRGGGSGGGGGGGVGGGERERGGGSIDARAGYAPAPARRDHAVPAAGSPAFRRP